MIVMPILATGCVDHDRRACSFAHLFLISYTNISDLTVLVLRTWSMFDTELTVLSKTYSQISYRASWDSMPT